MRPKVEGRPMIAGCSIPSPSGPNMLLGPAFFQKESSVEGGEEDSSSGGAEGAGYLFLDSSLEVALAVLAWGVTVTVVVAIS
jgi:hypothetical protein